MAVHKVACPKCRASLKSAQPIPVGKTVKCPKCGQAVVVPALQATASSPGSAGEVKKGSGWKKRGAVAGCIAFILLGLLGVWRFGLSRPMPRASFLNLTIGSESVSEVAETGFHWQEYFRGQPFRWTNGKARLVIPGIAFFQTVFPVFESTEKIPS